MIHRRLHLLMIMMLLVGCAVGPDYQQPAPPATTHWNDKGDGAVKSQTSSAATNPLVENLRLAAARQPD